MSKAKQVPSNGTLALTGTVSEAPASPGLQSWALVELYGHQRIVGHITADPVELPGTIRVDVPDLLKNGVVERKGLTRYFGKGAIYSITPVDEATVRAMLPHVDGLPARPAYLGDFYR